MFSRIFFVSALFILVNSHSAQAFDPSDPPGDDVINNTLQCEAGRVGDYLRKKKLPLNERVAISWKSSKTSDWGFGAGINALLLEIGIEAGLTRQDVFEAESTGIPFNLHPDNLKTCRGYQNEIIKEDVGLYRCLVNIKFSSLRSAMLGKSGTTGCHAKATITKKLKGSLKLPIWGASIGPNGSWGDSYVFDFTIVAPLRAH